MHINGSGVLFICSYTTSKYEIESGINDSFDKGATY